MAEQKTQKTTQEEKVQEQNQNVVLEQKGKINANQGFVLYHARLLKKFEEIPSPDVLQIRNVTAPEIAVLKTLYGDKAIQNIVDTGQELKISDKELHFRLKKKFNNKTAAPKVALLFDGLVAQNTPLVRVLPGVKRPSAGVKKI